MKIVIATAVYYPMINGVAVFSHNLASGLARRGHQVVVLCPSQTGKNYTKTDDGVEVHFLKSVQAKIYPDQIHKEPTKKGFFYKHGFRVSMFPKPEVKKILDEFQPDVVHVQVSDPIGLSVVSYARKRDIPVVTTEHNQPEVITEPLKMPTLVKKPMDALLTAYFVNRQNKSDFVTMPTKKAIHYLIYEKGKEFKVPVAAVSNGVDLSAFKSDTVPAEIYDKYKIPHDRPVVLYVGRVDPEKRVGQVIEAFLKMKGQLPSDLSNPLLLIVGDGVDRKRLVKLVRKMSAGKDVLLIGKVLPPDLYSLYNMGQVFATASTIETQGIVLVEAAASGLPLIAVDAGAVDEICLNDENGFLCEPGNIDEMAEAMLKILTDDDLRKKFAANSKKIAASHDFEKTLDSFINIYNKVIKNKV